MADHFTPADRRELTTTSVKLDGLKEDVAELKGLIATNAASNSSRTDKLEERLRVLENFRYWMLGGAAGIGALAGYFASKLHP